MMISGHVLKEELIEVQYENEHQDGVLQPVTCAARCVPSSSSGDTGGSDDVPTKIHPHLSQYVSDWCTSP